MSGGFNNPIVGGGGALVYPVIHSPNFVHGSAGWSINKDGSLEANDATIRGTVTAGTFQGTNYVINSTGEFRYSGIPALNNLIYSDTTNSGTDQYGNAYLAGVTNYTESSPGNYFATQIYVGQVSWYTATTGAGPWTILATLLLAQVLTSPVTNGLAISSGVPIAIDAPLAGPLAATQPGTISQETWHPLSLVNGWTAQAGLNTRYQLMPDNSVKLNAKLVAGTLTNGTVIATLPTGYQPANHQPVKIILENPTTMTAQALTPRAEVQTSGALLVFNLPTGLTQCSINDTFPLD